VKNLKLIDVLKVTGSVIAIISVIKAFREADHRSDKLEMVEALLRGATLTISVVLLIRHLRNEGVGEDLVALVQGESAGTPEATT
jgi:hypothetical protein